MKKKPTKKKPARKTPRVEIVVKWSFPLGMPLTKHIADTVKRQVDLALGRAIDIYDSFPQITLDVCEDIEEMDVVRDSVEVRRAR